MISLLKGWILRTQQGSVSEKHIDINLDEFTFKLIIEPQANEVSDFIIDY